MTTQHEYNRHDERLDGLTFLIVVLAIILLPILL